MKRVDLLASSAAFALGVVLLGVAIATQREPFTFQAGTEGTITTIALAALLLLLHGLAPSRALAWLAPVLLVEALSFVKNRSPVFAPLGIELFLAGALALTATSVHASREEDSRAPLR